MADTTEPWGPPPDADAIEAIARATLDALPAAFHRLRGAAVPCVGETIAG